MEGASIAIVGGGISGISAAVSLTKLGFKKITIFEARDRLGGRIHTKKYGAGLVEIGAQWIHGQGNNPIYKMALKHNLLAPYHDDKNLPFHDPVNNHFLSPDSALIAPSLVQEAHAEIENVMNEGRAFTKQNGDLEVSVGGYLAENYLKMIQQSDDTPHVKHIKQSILHWRLLMERTENGCNSMHDLGLNAFTQYGEFEGSDAIVFENSGYQGILDILIRKIPDCRIYLNCVVKEIAWDPDAVCDLFLQHQATLSSPTPKTAVLTSGGDLMTFDHVIMTCPLGYLKKHAATLFHPTLPASKLKAIDCIGFGTVNKVFLEFEKPFWDPKTKSYQFVWHPDDNFEPESLQDYRHLGNGEKWWQNLHSVETVKSCPCTLICWMPGEAAVIAESLPEWVVCNLCFELIVKFTGNPSIPRPKNMFCSRWSLDEFSLGSYSYIPKGFSSVLCDQLGESLPNDETPTLLFSGEATHQEYGTTRAAYESGQRVARSLALVYNQKSSM